jgi:hypothetical protein
MHGGGRATWGVSGQKRIVFAGKVVSRWLHGLSSVLARIQQNQYDLSDFVQPCDL